MSVRGSRVTVEPCSYTHKWTKLSVLTRWLYCQGKVKRHNFRAIVTNILPLHLLSKCFLQQATRIFIRYMFSNCHSGKKLKDPLNTLKIGKDRHRNSKKINFLVFNDHNFLNPQNWLTTYVSYSKLCRKLRCWTKSPLFWLGFPHGMLAQIGQT